MYGNALLKRSIAVFDELKQSVRDIDSWLIRQRAKSGLHAGWRSHTRSSRTLLNGLPNKYPRVVLHFDEVALFCHAQLYGIA